MMEPMSDSSDCESVLNVYDIRNVPSFLSSYDESLNGDSNVLNMTSLGAFMFLSQHESKNNFGLQPKKETEEPVDRSRLSLAYERLHNMPKVLLQELSPHVQILDISNNEFDNLSFLTKFKQLTTLIADHNNITSATSIPYLPKLELLWLNHCKIRDLYPWAKKLQLACPDLKYLSLMGNQAAPSYLNGGNFYEYLQYRLFIISLFPNLVHLDDTSVTSEQRSEADKVYKKPIIEVIVPVRRRTFLPPCLQRVSGKVCDMLTTTPLPFANQQKNTII